MNTSSLAEEFLQEGVARGLAKLSVYNGCAWRTLR